MSKTKISDHQLVLQSAKNAKAMRMANSLTKSQAANLVGVTPPTITRIESVTTKEFSKHYNPTIRTLTKLANAAGVTFEEFTTMELHYQ